MIRPNDDDNDDDDDNNNDDDDDDVDAMYDVLANDIHLSSTTFDDLITLRKTSVNDLQYVVKRSFVLLVNILN